MFSLGGCTKSPSPEAKEAVVALKKLQSRTQVGITYHDYSALLGDTFGSVKLFTESDNANGFPQLKAAMTASMQEYLRAGKAWDAQISKESAACSTSFILLSDARKKDLLIELDEKDISSLTSKYPLYSGNNWVEADCVYLEGLMQIRWSRGGKHLSEATKLLDE